MKKVYISIFIFLLLIGLSSFSFADSLSFSGNEYDMTSFTKDGFYNFAVNKIKPYYADVVNQSYFLYYITVDNTTRASVYFYDDYYFNANGNNKYTMSTKNGVAHTSYVSYGGSSFSGYYNMNYNYPIIRA